MPQAGAALRKGPPIQKLLLSFGFSLTCFCFLVSEVTAKAYKYRQMVGRSMWGAGGPHTDPSHYQLR